MALPALFLVHGGGMAADSWDLTVEVIHRLAPELTVLALDMPGRRNKPADLREMTIADYVESLVGDIESAGVEEIVIVGRSMGGMTLPGVVTKLGAARVREMIFAAAFLPPEGTSIVVEPLSWSRAARDGGSKRRSLAYSAVFLGVFYRDRALTCCFALGVC